MASRMVPAIVRPTFLNDLSSPRLTIHDRDNAKDDTSNAFVKAILSVYDDIPQIVLNSSIMDVLPLQPGDHT